MYRQIKVHPADWKLQRILWKTSASEDIQEFSLTTVTYGLSCAPFLALRTLRQLADDEEKRFPEGAASLRENSYVDDLLSGADTLDRALLLRDQLSQLCLAGGFPLRKWAASCAELLAGIPDAHQANPGSVRWESTASHSTLGLHWHALEDCFSFRIREVIEGPITRRSVLSRTAGLYDPLGWLSPVVVRAKIFIQHTWLLQLGWDDPLNHAEAKEWTNLERELHLLEDVRIPRWLGLEETQEDLLEIHGFADASERAYAAAVYLRTQGGGRSVRVFLAVAKTKVAPLKPVSLPRLELCAALLLARAVSHVLQCLNKPQAPVFLWSDSTVTLGWIRSHPARWTTFVANRVAEIQRLLPEGRWQHVRSEHNPADCASRGISPAELLTHPL